MSSIFNKKVAKYFLVLALLNFNGSVLNIHASTPEINSVTSIDQAQVQENNLISDLDKSDINDPKKNILRGMRYLKAAVESIMGANFKNEDVSSFISNIDSGEPFKYNDMEIDPSSNPLFRSLYKPILESWLTLREACSSTFLNGTSRNPVEGLHKKNALDYALTLGKAKDMGSYRLMSAIDFMEWWADSNNTFLNEKERKILRRISTDRNRYNLSKKFKDSDDMWEHSNASEFMDYWRAYGEGSLSELDMHKADDLD